MLMHITPCLQQLTEHKRNVLVAHNVSLLFWQIILHQHLNVFKDRVGNVTVRLKSQNYIVLGSVLLQNSFFQLCGNRQMFSFKSTVL